MTSASFLDETAAAAEAITMARRVNKLKNVNRFSVASGMHPQTLDVIRTRAKTLGFEAIADDAQKMLDHQDVSGMLLQQAGTTGETHNYAALIGELKLRKIMVSTTVNIMALMLLTAPGKQGAGIISDSAQRSGVSMSYSGPYTAFFVARDGYKRSMPGRIIGVSRDAAGNTALRMAMQTCEQHIRRGEANSSIYTSQVLLANIADLYAVYHGSIGLKCTANRVHRLTDILVVGLQQEGLKPHHVHYFDTLCVEVADKTGTSTYTKAAEINLRGDTLNAVGVTLDETTTRESVMQLFNVLLSSDHGLGIDTLGKDMAYDSRSIQPATLCDDRIPTHPMFNRYHSEAEMMRYIYSLECKGLALNQTMIPLGSCTAELNAAVEIIPIAWPEFAELHPLCPPEQAEGYQQMIAQLADWLVELTGYDAVRMQLNSGTQGEYAGLLAARRYHESRSEGHRDICLIPAFTHDTNPVSAHMAGMQVVVVACDKNDNIDPAGLRAEAEQAGDNLSYVMVTYPSTHGMYEETIREVYEVVYQFDGQAHLDGTNMNAQVGITSLGFAGADVSYPNLHKTFCIPHGGGGPGMGPIDIKAYLVSFVPGHSVVQIEGVLTCQGAVSAVLPDSASILPISRMCIRTTGVEGLKKASQVTILNANYIASHLQDASPMLYIGRGGRVAHECTLDIRSLKEETGISELDITKHLIDYGFHALTVSFPMAGTLMAEPTKSKSEVEPDRFIDAMLAIRTEVNQVGAGVWPLEDNLLVNAPHIQSELVAEWARPCGREVTVFPTGVANKYWPTVKRLGDVYGNRNLFRSCVPTSKYQRFTDLTIF